MSRQQLKEKGFTIIEVVLVLAIAALIFLMVFIALPALQRNQRDQARKDVVGKVSSAITTYQSNKRGAQPDSGKDIAGYVDGVVKDSDAVISNEYTIQVKAAASATFSGEGGTTTGAADLGIVQVITGAKCNENGDAATKNGATPRMAAIMVKMENGGDVFCQGV